MVRCAVCGREEAMPFICKYCGDYFCVKHHLPENHDCPGLETVKRAREAFFEPVKRDLYWGVERKGAVRRGVVFNFLEVRDLAVAIALVSLVYIFPRLFGLRLPTTLVSALLIGVSCAFILHELAHKFAAIHYGFDAYFKLSRIGVILTAVSIIPFLPIKVIAPGYVEISARDRFDISTSRRGLIALSGPLTNLVLSFFFIMASRLWPFFYYAAKVNADIAFFNVMPFAILDGAQILRWKPSVWVAVFLPILLIWGVLNFTPYIFG